MTDVEERVEAGAEWLDEHAPGWEHKLSFQELKMESPCSCVLGQVFFQEALAAGILNSEWHDQDLVTKPAGFHYAGKRVGLCNSEELGFDAMGGEPEEYDELRDAWLALVKDRFDNGTLSG